MKQSIFALYPIKTLLDLDLSNMPDNAVWISPLIHQLEVPASLEDMDLISYLYSNHSL